jgi:hypothetical protein
MIAEDASSTGTIELLLQDGGAGRKIARAQITTVSKYDLSSIVRLFEVV